MTANTMLEKIINDIKKTGSEIKKHPLTENAYSGAFDTFYQYIKTLNNNNVWALEIDNKEQIWIGTSSGVNVLDPNSNKFSYYNQENHMQDIQIHLFCLYQVYRI